MTGSRFSWIVLALATACGSKSAPPAAFNPTANASLTGGSHSYASVSIPAGVTVTVAADVVLQVSGDISIAGNLIGDCAAIDLEGQGALAITGKVDNRCSAAGSKDLILHTAGGHLLQVGKPGAPARLQTSGRLDVSNDPTLLSSDFALRPRPLSAQAASGCDGTGAANFYDAVGERVPAQPNSAGARQSVTSRGDLVIGGDTQMLAQDGADGADSSGDAASAERGHEGGGLAISASGTLTLCQGAELQGASGGKGGNAIGKSSAVGGPGGDAGSIRVKAAQVVIDGNMHIAIGSGGAGGNATATGQRGADGCSAAAAAGGSASSVGAGGGDVGSSNNPIEFPFASGVNVTAGQAGKSGDATATGGDGGAASCGSSSTGGKGGLADARSQPGGFVHIAMPLSVSIKPGAGGKAVAKGGAGGVGEPVAPSPCGSASTGYDVAGTGGKGGDAIAICAVGLSTMPSPQPPEPCTAISTGGAGAAGLALAGVCSGCGLSATGAGAYGGIGGAAEVGVPPEAASSTGNAATAGAGGKAVATGGSGAACNSCPAGPGASGGAATAEGGNGGLATGAGAVVLTNGVGGNAVANGGVGGDGASCCGGAPVSGGAGGFGGAATARAGAGGGDSGAAGNGGNGGDGKGPGYGGPGGVGAGTPARLADGTVGNPGNACGATLGTCQPVAPTPQAIASSDTNVTVFYRTDSPTSAAPCTQPPTVLLRSFAVSGGPTYTPGSTLTVPAPPYDAYHSASFPIPTNQPFVFTAEGISDAGVGSGQSAYSSAVQIYPRPPPPGSFAATAINSASVRVTWAPPAYDGGTAISFYGLYEQQTDGGFASTTAVLGADAGTVYNLAPGTSYTFALASVLSNLQQSALSNPSTVSTYATPGVPQGVQATPGAYSVLVSWTSPSTTGSGPLTDYIVSRNHTGNFASQIDQSYFAGADAGSYLIRFANADAGTQFFAVQADNAYGSSAYSAPISAAPLFPPTYLSYLNVNPGTRQLGISWPPPHDLGIGPVDYYEITVTDQADGGTIYFANSDAGNSLLVGSLIDGDNYSAKVRAHNRDGFGPAATSAGSPLAWNGIGAGVPGNLYAGFSAAQAQGGVIVTGGTTGISGPLPTGAYYAPILFDGTLAPAWTALPALNQPLLGHTTVAWQGAGGAPVVALVAGGRTGASSSALHDWDGIDRLVLPASPSAAGAWSQAGAPLPSARHDHAAAISGSYLYVIGGLSSTFADGGPGPGALADVNVATLNADGTLPSTSTWTAVTSLPSKRYGAASVVIGSRLYVVGGVSAGASVTDVIHADINSDGSLGAWSYSTPLPAARSYATAQSDGRFLYVVGGALDPSQPGSFSAQLQRSFIDATTGNGGAWVTDPASFPVTPSIVPSVYFNRTLYVLEPSYPFSGSTDADGGFVGP